MAVNLHRDRPTEMRLVPGERLAQAAVKFRIARLPDLVADVNARKVHRLAPKRDRHLAALDFGLWTLDIEYPPAFLLLFGMSAVKHHAVARLERRLQTQ